jgi:hypothetical protein
MKWVTRERSKTDRIACPWLIRRFIDPEPRSTTSRPTRSWRSRRPRPPAAPTGCSWAAWV